MKKTTISLAISTALLAPTAYAADNIHDAIKNGVVNLDFLLRYEDVDVDTDAADDEAQALTLRSRINYTTAAFNSFTGFIELDDVTAYDDDDYASGTNGVTDKAVISDPEGTEVNQVWVNYNNWDSNIKWGRQRIALDNHRFIGTVGFRQNEQTYDAFTIVNNSLTKTIVSAGRITNVNRIFGEDHAAGDISQDTHYLNVNYAGLPIGSIVGYAILMDATTDNWDTDTYGLRFNGSQAISNLKLGYTVEWATQEDAEDNSARYDADYLLLEGSLTAADCNITLGQETLGADDADGQFITPFATLHKFQGWTDQFLGGGTGNIAGGIVDSYISVSTKVSGIELMAVYHDFESDDKDANGLTGDDLGDEYGLQAAKNFGNYGLSLKYASYDAGDRNINDVDKLWLTATAKF
jgi:hypothetical protein